MSTTKRPSSSGERRRFDPAFKRGTVELGRRIGIAQAAKDFGLSESGLRGWSKAVDRRGGVALSLPWDRRFSTGSGDWPFSECPSTNRT